jgi:cytochrome P450
LGFEFAQMEMKIILATLLRQYDWTVTPDRETIAPVYQPSKIQDKLRAHIQQLRQTTR